MADRSNRKRDNGRVEIREITPADIDRVMSRALERERQWFRITPSQRRAARKRA
jgi:hypothetical protein